MTAPTKSPTFLEVLQTAVDASVPSSRNIVVYRVLQQLGMAVHPERALTKEGMTYTWKAVPLLGDIVLGADGKLSALGMKAVVANPAKEWPAPQPPEKPGDTIMWAMSFRALCETAPDPTRAREVLSRSARVLLSAPP